MRKTVSAACAATLVWAIVCACGGDDEVDTGRGAPDAAADGSPEGGSRDGGVTSDAGDAPDAGDASDAARPDGGCEPGAPCGPAALNRAFVTSTKHVLGAVGGLAGADAICNQRAAAAGLGGTYVAWLASSVESAASRLAAASGWVRTDGKPFAKSREDLLAGRLLHPLELDEAGSTAEDALAERVVGTGTDVGGGTTGETYTCRDWTSTDGETPGGVFSRLGQQWSTTYLKDCSSPSRLYCLGVDHDAPYTVTPVEGRKAFVSTAGFAPGDGVAAADALCASDAASAGLTGTFRALLATSSASAIARFDAGGAPWVRIDGVPLTATASALAGGGALDAPVFLPATGVAEPEGNLVWTGGASTNVAGADTCGDWTSTNADIGGGVGHSDDARGWFQVTGLRAGSVASCQSGMFVNKVYCFEE